MKSNRFKQWVAALTCAAFIGAETRQSKSQGVLTPLCIVIVLGTAALVGTVIVRGCRPKYRCYSKGHKETATNACLVLTVRAAEIDGWTSGGTNSWRNVAECIAWCCPGKTNGPAIADPEPASDSSGFAVVEKSTDGGKTWTANLMTVNEDGYYEFRDRITTPNAMYRAFSDGEP